MKRLSQFAFPAWSVPIMLFVLCFLCYGIQIREMSFFWDDWPSIWFNHIGGSAIFKETFASDRPLLGRLFMLTMPLLGSSILRWQVFGILMRWLASLSLWWCLNQLWKGHLRENSGIALLFAISPAFLQQWVVVTYSHIFFIYAIFLMSIGLMLKAFRLNESPGQNKRWIFWTLLLSSLGFAAIAHFSAEYFIGLELLRPILIWMVIKETKTDFIQIPPWRQGFRIFQNWFPYIILLFIFAYWRIFIQGFPRAQIQLPNPNSIGSLIPFFITLEQSLVNIIQDLLEVNVGAWGIALQPASLLDFSSPFYTQYYWLVALFCSFGIFYYLSSIRSSQRTIFAAKPVNDKEIQTGESWNPHFILLGIFALIAGGIPFWLIKLSYSPIFPYDRSALPLLFGASILTMGICESIFRTIQQKNLALAILVFLAFNFHYQNATSFIKENEDVKTFFWQLSWRIPSITPGTTLMTPKWYFRYNTDNSLSAPLNWIYSPEDTSREMKYLFIDVTTRLGGSLPGTRDQPVFRDEGEDNNQILIKQNQPIVIEYRAVKFIGNTSKSIIFDFQPPACLKILDPKRDAYLYTYPQSFRDVLPLSKPELILISTPQTKSSTPNSISAPMLPFGLFGKEIKGDWCHYFEEADLARQNNDWQKIAAIGKVAFDERKHKPHEASEYLPFIEGYALSGDLKKAETLTEEAYSRRSTLQPALCKIWDTLRISQTNSNTQMQTITNIMNKMACIPLVD